jgi:hypothetical protein
MLKATLLGTLVAAALLGVPAPALSDAPRTTGQEALPPAATEIFDYGFDNTAADSLTALAAEIAAWLSVNFELPAVDRPPRIEFASPIRINALRYRGLIKGQTSQDLALPNSAGQTVAIYVDKTFTIYLPSGWTGTTPAETSMLVHEMVHHIQNVARIKHDCPQAREKVAYAAQERWLRRFDRSLESEFEVDPFTVLARTLCMQ